MAKLLYKFRPNVDIGGLDAENDKYLLKSFVEKEELQYLRDIENNKCIILGRTGSGKTALILRLASNGATLKKIDPLSMSLRHLSNSTIINYFKSYEVSLDLFYKVLWKHVFIVEIIKLYYGDDLKKSKRFFDYIRERKAQDRKKKLAVEYLEKWEDKFWEDTEYQIKELESRMEISFKNEIKDEEGLYTIVGSEEEIKKDPQYERKKVLVKHKADKVINESQIEAITEIMDLLRDDLLPNTQKKLYIVMDDLDKEWVDSKIVYDLIKSLIDTIKGFRNLPNLKIIIALRTNILKKIFRESTSRGMQREKFNNLYLDLKWSKTELEELIYKRLGTLIKGKYTKSTPKVEDVLPSASKNEKSGFDYMLERSFYRPRDIIDFFNKCMKCAQGKTKISRENLKEAESEYSRERLDALCDEWQENYGRLEVIYSFLKNVKNGFKIDEIKEKAEESFIEQISSDRIKELNHKEIACLLTAFGNSLDNVIPCLKKVLLQLYEIGLIGIKLTPQHKIEYAIDNPGQITTEEFNENTKFYVHKMFVRALKIQHAEEVAISN